MRQSNGLSTLWFSRIVFLPNSKIVLDLTNVRFWDTLCFVFKKAIERNYQYLHSGIRSSSLIVRSLPLGMESCFKQSEDSTNKDSRSIGFKLIIVLYIQQYRIHVYLFIAVPVILLITVKSIPFQRDCVYTYRTLYSVDRILEIYRLCYHCSFVQQHRAV